MTRLHNNTQILNWLKVIFVVSLFSLSQHALAKTIVVKTDRQTVEMGDVITVLVEADFQSKGAQISFDKLRDQFELLNQQQSNHIEVINGKYSSFSRWRAQLLPKQPGTLIIPPFELDGVKSKPYKITVRKVQYNDANRPYFLEAQADKTEAYVQEQVLYTLRFFHKGSLVQGNIRPPKFDNSLSEQLKEQQPYGKTIKGQQYTVYEWQYAFFPQASGTLEIPGPSFTGLLELRGGQKGVRAKAKAIKIKVKPKPNKATSQDWIPASAVRLYQKWDKLPKEVAVGDSLRRTITLEVEGLKQSQLPELRIENGVNFKVYSDTAQKTQYISERGITSRVTLSQAIVPTEQGTMQIPDLTITWLNTTNNKVETAVLNTDPIIIVAPESLIPSPVQGDPTQNEKVLTTSSEALTILNKHRYIDPELHTIASYVYWPVIVLAMVLLWLITLLMWVRTNRKLKQYIAANEQKKHSIKDEAGKLKFNKQWCELPLNEFYPELLRQLHEDMGIASVEDIPNEHLREAIRQLESHLFGGEKIGYTTMQDICDNWAALINRQNKDGQAVAAPGELETLYKN